MKDSVKVTVIATGFRVETPLLDAERDSSGFMSAIPATIPVVAGIPEPPALPPMEPPAVEEPVAASISMDLDDLDTPAYLRQGKLLN